MLTTRCTVILMLAVAASAIPVHSQEASSRRRSIRNHESVARAAWQPVRPASSSESREEPRKSRQVRLAAQMQEDLPAPTNPPAPVVEVPLGQEIQPEPLDGQIILRPLEEGIVACDGLPGACGCGELACDGGCDSLADCSDGFCGGDPTCGELCSPTAWRPCITLCMPQDGWASFEYLSWWQDGMSLPPLVTSSVGSVPGTAAGVLGRDTTNVLFGGDEVLEDSFDGGRFRFGVWLDRCHTWGLGAEYFGFDRESVGFRATSTGTPILARPFFNTETGDNDADLIAFPNLISGTVAARADSELAGWSVHLRSLRGTDEGCSKWLFCGCPDHYCGRTEMLVGYRGLEFDESVTITEDVVSAQGEAFDLLDRFETRNQFNGFDIGWAYRRTRGYWTFDTALRLAVGSTHQTVKIDGQTTINEAGSPARTLTGGLLAQTSNIGTYEQDEFTVVPEWNLNVGYQLTDHWKATFGYTFIYWSNVVRPGQHIPTDLNPGLIPPPIEPLTGIRRPAFAFDTTDYWVQGISAGAEYRW